MSRSILERTKAIHQECQKLKTKIKNMKTLKPKCKTYMLTEVKCIEENLISIKEWEDISNNGGKYV